MLSKGRARYGFSLIELLLAVVCLAVSSGGVLSALKYANDKTIGARQRAIALVTACSQLDGAKSDAFNNVIASGTTIVNSAVSGIPGTTTVTKTIAQQGTTPLFNVTVQVQWTFQSQPQSVTLETVLWKGNVT
jgi:prepilin-type N-terminal cleavage/methylation domain-containing protein